LGATTKNPSVYLWISFFFSTFAFALRLCVKQSGVMDFQEGAKGKWDTNAIGEQGQRLDD
jgi:hypothetical protein